MRGLVAIAFASALASVASVARANPPLHVTSTITLAGDHSYSEVVVDVGATIRVRPFNPSTQQPCAGGGDGCKDDERGEIRIFADTITVKGTIDATGAGAPGVDGSDGLGPSPGQADNVAASGAGFAGLGGASHDASCVAGKMGGAGGVDWRGLVLGSSGGAAKAGAGIPSSGGSGGGRIDLEASVIVVDGKLVADGAPGFLAVDGDASGGGSGGVIRLVAGSLQGGGVLSVRGGAGADAFSTTATPIKTGSSGGGGGGWIVLRAPSVPASLSSRFAIGGGVPGSCPDPAGDGALVVEEGLACLDLDHDGVFSGACANGAGTDCDDSDPAIHPGAVEICDGRDNDCNGVVDDVGEDACPPGEVCRDGACAIVHDAGAADPGTPPDHVAFEGGCGLGRDAPSPGGLAVFGLVVAALGARRVRRRRSTHRLG